MLLHALHVVVNIVSPTVFNLIHHSYFFTEQVAACWLLLPELCASSSLPCAAASGCALAGRAPATACNECPINEMNLWAMLHGAPCTALACCAFKVCADASVAH